MQEATNAIFQMRFPQKLWYLLDLQTSAIIWGGTGRTILLNYRLLQNYLQCDHSIFKTTNISSFIRQLNLYGFRKVTSHLQDPLCNSSNPYMHEFIHDNFQYGRPELLNKITRKALTIKSIKRGLKPKSLDTSDHLLYVSPLQKARRALRIALKKAAQDLLILNSSRLDLQSEDCSEDICDDEENIEFDWLITKSDSSEKQLEISKPDVETQVESATSNTYEKSAQDGLIDFSIENCQQTNDNFQTQFLSMPDLDTESTEDNSGVELLAEFNTNHDVDGDIAKKRIYNECNSLNCVLPSVTDEIDDVGVVEKSDVNPYNGEWDQMFIDIMGNKGSSQEGVSNLKDLYSQISQTIDLLNS
ncbi:unnamed protein product, partial [Brenthis ino]